MGKQSLLQQSKILLSTLLMIQPALPITTMAAEHPGEEETSAVEMLPDENGASTDLMEETSVEEILEEEITSEPEEAIAEEAEKESEEIIEEEIPLEESIEERIEETIQEDEKAAEILTEEIVTDNKSETASLLAENPVVTISSDWNGSVFGDVGGQDKITPENFEITENEDGTVKVRSSNNRGKISGGTDGIAYYFQEVPVDADFEFSATAHVDAFAANNQVSFGMMLRDEVFENLHGTEYAKGNQISLGALDQKMKVFTRQNEALQKYDLAGDISAPEIGATYDLYVKKMGPLLIFRIGDEEKIIEDYSGAIQYAGLFTSRNAEVTYSNISLHVEEDVEPEVGEWNFSAFGSNTSETKNPVPVIGEDGSITLSASGGKISSSDEGMSFYSNTLPAGTNFEIKTKAVVRSFNQDSSISTPNQKSFGIMLRDEVAEKGTSSKTSANYVAVGALDTVMKGFYKKETQVKLDPYEETNLPTTGEEYDLSIKKSGDIYLLSVNGEEQILNEEELFSGEIYAGIYVARDAEVTFYDTNIQIDSQKVNSLEVDVNEMKTSYLVNEPLDLSGLKVTAFYSDGSTEEVTDYVATGFDSSQAGEQLLTVHYNGAMVQIPIQIEALTVTDLQVVYLPARTHYYLGDSFAEDGLVLEATYNNGETIRLAREKYEIDVEEAFTKAGEQEILITSTETPEQTVTLRVHVSDARLTQLEISKEPEIILYYLGDKLDLDGLVLYAHYSDGSKVRLTKGDYTVSELDTSSPGTKTVTLSYKGKEEKLQVKVKEKEMTGIIVKDYPKTTYTVGETFSEENLIVAKQYDNGDLEELPKKEYALEVPTFTKAGTYEILIQPTDKTIEPIRLPVTVIDEVQYEWKEIRFGQSSSKEKNYVSVQEDGTVEVVALEGGGKVTGDHDGIAFYYTEIDAKEENFELSATIDVKEYAKQPDHDGQESFGIMARDAIGEANNSSVFASNIAAIGGFSGGTKEMNGTQLFVRTGVETPDGAGSNGIQKIMLQEGRPEGSYKLTLKKTNSGYAGRINDGKEEILFEPEILEVQDTKIYVGFYAARLATIEVSDIELTVTKAATDAPKIEPPAVAVEPNFAFTSLDKTSLKEYELKLAANVDGTITVKQGDEVLAADLEVKAGTEASIPTTLQSGLNKFSVSFLPEDTQYLTSYDKIVQNFTVENRVYEGDIHVTPDGKPTADGSSEHPLDVDTALQFVQPGQKIIVHDGVYMRDARINIKKYNDGTAEEMKYLVAAEGANPVFDFDKKTEGVILSGDYWHIKGIDFRHSAPNTRGFVVGGSHNIIEQANFYANGDTGLQISRTDQSDRMEDWPSHNLILNCSSYDNRDPSDNNADGFAAKLTSGEGNVFRGCIAYNNIDDGWDLYTKAGSGKIGAVLIEDSIAYNNGFVSYDYDGTGDGNGFKLGGEGIHVPHTIRNSMAFGNLADGFTSNSNPGVIAENNISFNNTGKNLSFTTYGHIPTDFSIDEFVSYRSEVLISFAEETETKKMPADAYPAELAADNNYFFDGEKSVNKSGIVLTDDNFESLEFTPFERDENGDIIWGSFLSFIAPETEDPNEPGEPDEPGDTENPDDTEDLGDTEKPGDTEDSGDTEEPGKPGEPEDSGDTEDPVDAEESGKSDPTDDSQKQEETKEEKLPDTGVAASFAKVAGAFLLVAGIVTFIVSRKKKLD